MSRPVKPNRGQVAVATVAAALLAVHVALVARLGAGQSPNVDEPAHLAAGMAMWQYGSFDLYCVNPPLARAAATLPVLCMSHEELWGDFEGAPQPRPEFVLGAQFVESHPDRWERFLVAGRWALLPFTIAGGVFCYFWAAELFGRPSGLLALALWCFSPEILTWSSVIGTDAAAAAVGVGAGYFFWRWLRRPTWGRAAAAGLFLGLAVLSKTTWVLLFGVWPALWLFWRWTGLRHAERPRAAGLAFALLIGLYTVNLGYACRGSLTPLGDFEFYSRLFTGAGSEGGEPVPGNRFAGSPLGRLPVPLPEAFVRGIDLQKVDFETRRNGSRSYLFGEWSDRGWWYYYLAGLGLKVPLGVWCLGLIAAVGCLSRLREGSAGLSGGAGRTDGPALADHVAVLAPGVAVLALVSSQDGFSHHFRYVLPALPFAFVWAGQAARAVGPGRWFSSAVVLASTGWAVAAPLGVYPHTISYFNELAGGPSNGHRYMLGSSFCWSQDRFYLRDWLRDHPEADSPYMLLERSVSLERLGLRSRGEPPRGGPAPGEGDGAGDRTYGPVPGWHVVDVQRLHDPDGAYLYFLEFEPVATIGYSTYIYQIDAEAANRVRRDASWPELRSPPDLDALAGELAAARDSSGRTAAALFLPTGGEPAPGEEIRDVVRGDESVSLTVVSEKDIREGRLGGYDVLVVPGGHAGVQGTALGAAGRKAVREFVRGGGGYVGVCAGAFLAGVNDEWGLKIVNARTETGERFVPGLGNVSASFRGWGTVSVDLTADGNRLFGGSPRRHRMDHTGGPVLYRANEPDLPDYRSLASYGSELWRHPFQRGTMIGTPAMVATKFGRGKVVLFGPHPVAGGGRENLLTQAIRACRDPERLARSAR